MESNNGRTIGITAMAVVCVLGYSMFYFYAIKVENAQIEL